MANHYFTPTSHPLSRLSLRYDMMSESARVMMTIYDQRKEMEDDKMSPLVSLIYNSQLVLFLFYLVIYACMIDTWMNLYRTYLVQGAWYKVQTDVQIVQTTEKVPSTRYLSPKQSRASPQSFQYFLLYESITVNLLGFDHSNALWTALMCTLFYGLNTYHF